MKNIVKYANRKLYDTETSKYVNLKELLALPLGSFKVTSKETGADLTVETLFSYLANSSSDPIVDAKEIKVKVMQHCINILSA
jgi:polyhydroxyalkanoate synthesis regulator protein